MHYLSFFLCVFFFFNDTATTEIYTLSLHDALPISITLAIFRRQLFDIQLVFSRSLLYVLLTGGIIAAYLAWSPSSTSSSARAAPSGRRCSRRSSSPPASTPSASSSSAS